jgi:hypothetical protein
MTRSISAPLSVQSSGCCTPCRQAAQSNVPSGRAAWRCRCRAPGGDVEDLDLAARPDAGTDVVDEATGLDALADDQDLVALAQLEPVVDHVAGDLGLAPHERQAAQQHGAAPALLLGAVHDDLAETGDVIRLHPGPRILVVHLRRDVLS